MITEKITLYRKDSKTYDFILKRKGVPINISEKTVYFTAKTAYDGTELFSVTCVNDVAAEGTCQGVLSSADTDTICTNAIAEIMIKDSTGKQDTLGQFYIDILKDVKTD